MKTLLKEATNTIKKSFKKFISLVFIILLGVGFFVGMKVTTPDMKATAVNFFSRSNFMDIQIAALIGLDENEIKQLKDKVEEIDEIEGSYRTELVTNLAGSEVVLVVHSYNENDKLNKADLISGRYPESIDECVVEQAILDDLEYSIGDYIELNEDEFEKSIVKIVGAVRSPLYISSDRGTTSLLSGKINYYVYAYHENFKSDVFTIAYLTLKEKVNPFFEEYDQLVDNVSKKIKDVSQEISQERNQQVIAERQKDVAELEAQYNEKSAEVNNELNNAQAAIDNAQNEINNAYSQILTDDEITAQLNIEKQKLDNAKSELDSARAKLDDYKIKLEQAAAELAKNKEEYNNQVAAYADELNALKQQREALQIKIQESQNTIAQYQSDYAKYKTEYDNALTNARKQKYQGLMDDCSAKIETEKQKISTYQQQLSDIESKLNAFENNEYIKKIQDAENEYNSQKSLYEQYEQQYNSSYADYNAGLAKYEEAKNTVYDQMHNNKAQIDAKNDELNEKRQEFEEQKSKALNELQNFKNQINELKDKIALLEFSTWYVYGRSSNSGYSQYADDVARISNLSKVFPVIFFLVAALITLTSISRMVEDDRIQIGTLKALGYHNRQIMLKYLMYAFFSSVVGSILGMLVGFTIVPIIIYKVYAMMYDLPSISLQVDFNYALIGFGLAFLSTVVTAFFSARKVLKEEPSKLMRAKSPKFGKKYFFERITFIWKKLSFSQKVTLRNLIMYKKRLFMTIIGVAGCTALIIAGFGLQSSITSIIPIQFGELFEIEIQMFYKDDVERSKIDEEVIRLKELDEIEDVLLANFQTVTTSDNYHKTYSVNFVVPSDPEKFESFVNLRDSKTKKIYKLTSDGAIITEKLAELLGLKVGDKLTFTDTYNQSYEITISAICENYIQHYIYMTKEYYNTLKEGDLRNNMMLVKTQGVYNESQLAKKINKKYYLSSLLYSSSTEEMNEMIMDNLNIVVIFIIVAAGILAFVVLYNLSNINIMERKVELATLKVLGLKNGEVHNYVKKEMDLLTYVGIILGVIFGYHLNNIVIETCEVSSLMFNRNLDIKIYILSILITLVFAKIVDSITAKELGKINMIESLKVRE